MNIIEALAGAVAGAAIILALAFVFLMSAPLAHAASCSQMTASWYGAESGNRTADGSYFDGTQMIAAHKTLAFGTKLRVTYRGKSVDVVVRDRGPYIKGRQLDLSHAAAKRIGLTAAGVGKVTVCRR